MKTKTERGGAARALAAALAVLVALSLLAGCGGGGGGGGEAATTAAQSEATTAAAQAEATTAEAAAAEATTAAAAPAGEGAARITVEVFDRGTDDGKTDPTNNYYTDWIKQKVLADENIEVEFLAVSRWEEVDQLNNLMAAGTAPDICFTYDANLIANYRDLGGLYDMSAGVDQYMPDLKAFLGSDPAIEGRDLIYRNQVSETGALYNIPARRMNAAGGNTFIRKDWLDKLGLPLPTTLQEFHDALVAFKEQDPGGVGAGNVVPFTMTTDVRWRASTILESFLDPDIPRRDLWVNTVIDRYFLQPGYKEGFRYLNQMYNEGLIDPEFPLYEDDTPADNLIKSGVVGAFIHNWDQAYRDSPGLLADLRKNVPDAEFVTVDCFPNAAGRTAKFNYDVAGLNFFIPAASKNAEAAMRYINWLSKYENFHYLQIGDEGVTHDVVDGLPKLKAATGPQIMNSPQNIDYTIMINGLYMGDEDTTVKTLANSYSFDAELITKAYEDAMRDGFTIPVLPVTLSAAGPYSQVLLDKGKVLMAESVTAAASDFDKVWDDAIADWLASGAQEIIDERAAKYVE